MSYRYILEGGCGSTKIGIKFVTDSDFVIKVRHHWMGSDKLRVKITGHYKTLTMGYHLLTVQKIVDRISKNKFGFDKDVICPTFELFDLPELVRIDDPNDINYECLEMANSGYFNNIAATYNACLFGKWNAYYYKNNGEEFVNMILRLFKDVKLVKKN